MLVGELIIRRQLIKKNLEDVKRYLAKKEETTSRSTYNDFIDQLFAYLEQLKSHTVLLNRSNESTMLTIGKNEISVADAVYLKESILNKISILSSMIEHNTTRDLDIFNLIEQRDKIFEEYVYLATIINESDWSTEVQ